MTTFTSLGMKSSSSCGVLFSSFEAERRQATVFTENGKVHDFAVLQLPKVDASKSAVLDTCILCAGTAGECYEGLQLNGSSVQHRRDHVF